MHCLNLLRHPIIIEAAIQLFSEITTVDYAIANVGLVNSGSDVDAARKSI